MNATKISQLNSEIQHLQAQNSVLETELQNAKNQLDWFRRQLFGRKSEKQLHLIDNPQQSVLFTVEETPATEEATSPEVEVKSHRRTSRTQRTGNEVTDSGLRFDDSVPRQIIELSAPELEGEHADEYEIIDYKETHKLGQLPGSYVVLTERRPVVRHKSTQTLRTVPGTTSVLDGCYADVSFLAGMMVDKAVYHLPLYRQHQRLAAAGITLSRATLTNWMQSAISLLEPVYQAQLRQVLSSQVLAMDETPVKVGREADDPKRGKGKMKTTYFWPVFGDQDEVAFVWSQGRGQKHVYDQLKGFTGTLISDGYAAYHRTVAKLNAQEEVMVHANCWAHSRRYFEKAKAQEPEAAQWALNTIAGLYLGEKKIRAQEMDAAKTLEYRQKHSEPLVNAFFHWVQEQRLRPELLPKALLRTAVEYVAARERELRVFLSNPHVPIDTNHLERALRVIPMGRKNYLFCWSELGAKQLGILQSLMVSCRLQGVDPYTYLVDVLQRVGTHPASKVDDLIPRNWKERFKDNFFTSQIDIWRGSNP